MKKISMCMLVTAIASGMNAQTTTDRDNVKKLCGCYSVEFKYAETFSPVKDYQFHKRDEIDGAVELAFPVEESENKIVIQHLLVVDENTIVKHWREDWTYENPVIWKYLGGNVWVKENLSPDQVKSGWTQTVWEVSDAPRYQGNSPWVWLDGKTVWQNTADAPLPRREYTVRNDYNILRRTNRLVLNDKGYLHEQDNRKIIRKDSVDNLLVEEKGINSYTRINEKNCEPAKAWWTKNQVYWTKVKIVWDQYLETHDIVVLKDKVEGKPMYENLMSMASAYTDGKIKPEEIDARIKASFDQYVGDKRELAQLY